jgi:SAM-dependent methyltransferase
MPTPTSRPGWQLPRGVPRGLWEYAQSPQIASDYDSYFAENSLFEFDEQILLSTFERPGRVVDLGCGTGRALLPLLRQGLQGLAVDLSHHMLRQVAEKGAAEGLRVDCLRANLVELDCVADGSIEYAMCMFSTLGMIRGRAHRRALLAHARRILKPQGRFVLHVHNFWHNLLDPGGPWWVLSSLLAAPFRSDEEVGDKFFHYRGIPNMFLHVFRPGELQRDLRWAGLAIERTIPLDAARRHPLRHPWLLGRIRANGWIVVCRPAQQP